MLASVITTFDRALRTVAGVSGSARPTPGRDLVEAELSREEQCHVAGLMRVNHTGEVCAQALYSAQALVARDPALRDHRAAFQVLDREAIHMIGQMLFDLALRLDDEAEIRAVACDAGRDADPEGAEIPQRVKS